MGVTDAIAISAAVWQQLEIDCELAIYDLRFGN
jgi:hypothetical protein